MASGLSKTDRKKVAKFRDKLAYTPISEKEVEKKIQQLIKDLQSGKKTVPVSYPKGRWRI